MTSGLNTRLTDEELAVEFRWTLHTRWRLLAHTFELAKNRVSALVI